MNREQKTNQLNDEVSMAHKAQVAYDAYLRAFIAESRARIFSEIEACESSNIILLTELKYMLTAVNSLLFNIESDIETGKLAQTQLDETNGD